MFYFYVIKSIKDKNLYLGFTKNLKKRLIEHNLGEEKSTKNRRSFKLVYYEAYLSEDEARNRERQIKRRAKSYISLRRRIKKSISLI